MWLLDWLATLAPLRWPSALGFGLCFVLGTFVFVGDHPGPSGPQPIAFNHAKHIQNQMACTDCHTGAQNEVRATLPALETCLLCHQAALTASAEEAKIRVLAAAKKELAWIRLTRMPAHVYFSHRPHAKVTSNTCHGPMDKATVPPPRPFLRLTMDACIQCHEQKRAGTDCNDCHR